MLILKNLALFEMTDAINIVISTSMRGKISSNENISPIVGMTKSKFVTGISIRVETSS